MAGVLGGAALVAIVGIIAAALAVISLVFFVKMLLRSLAARAMVVGERQLVKGVTHLAKEAAEEARKNDPKRQEAEVTALAEKKRGSLAVADVIASLQMSQFQAQETLARLVRRKVCTIHNGPLGARYVFEAFLPRQQVLRCAFCDAEFAEPVEGNCPNCGGKVETVTVVQPSV